MPKKTKGPKLGGFAASGVVGFKDVSHDIDTSRDATIANVLNSRKSDPKLIDLLNKCSNSTKREERIESCDKLMKDLESRSDGKLQATLMLPEISEACLAMNASNMVLVRDRCYTLMTFTRNMLAKDKPEEYEPHEKVAITIAMMGDINADCQLICKRFLQTHTDLKAKVIMYRTEIIQRIVDRLKTALRIYLSKRSNTGFAQDLERAMQGMTQYLTQLVNLEFTSNQMAPEKVFLIDLAADETLDAIYEDRGIKGLKLSHFSMWSRILMILQDASTDKAERVLNRINFFQFDYKDCELINTVLDFTCAALATSCLSYSPLLAKLRLFVSKIIAKAVVHDIRPIAIGLHISKMICDYRNANPEDKTVQQTMQVMMTAIYTSMKITTDPDLLSLQQERYWKLVELSKSDSDLHSQSDTNKSTLLNWKESSFGVLQTMTLTAKMLRNGLLKRVPLQCVAYIRNNNCAVSLIVAASQALLRSSKTTMTTEHVMILHESHIFRRLAPLFEIVAMIQQTSRCGGENTTCTLPVQLGINIVKSWLPEIVQIMSLETFNPLETLWRACKLLADNWNGQLLADLLLTSYRCDSGMPLRPMTILDGYVGSLVALLQKFKHSEKYMDRLNCLTAIIQMIIHFVLVTDIKKRRREELMRAIFEAAEPSFKKASVHFIGKALFSCRDENRWSRVRLLELISRSGVAFEQILFPPWHNPDLSFADTFAITKVALLSHRRRQFLLHMFSMVVSKGFYIREKALYNILLCLAMVAKQQRRRLEPSAIADLIFFIKHLLLNIRQDTSCVFLLYDELMSSWAAVVMSSGRMIAITRYFLAKLISCSDVSERFIFVPLMSNLITTLLGAAKSKNQLRVGMAVLEIVHRIGEFVAEHLADGTSFCQLAFVPVARRNIRASKPFTIKLIGEAFTGVTLLAAITNSQWWKTLLAEERQKSSEMDDVFAKILSSLIAAIGWLSFAVYVVAREYIDSIPVGSLPFYANNYKAVTEAVTSQFPAITDDLLTRYAGRISLFDLGLFGAGIERLCSCIDGWQHDIRNAIMRSLEECTYFRKDMIDVQLILQATRAKSSVPLENEICEFCCKRLLSPLLNKQAVPAVLRSFFWITYVAPEMLYALEMWSLIVYVLNQTRTSNSCLSLLCAAVRFCGALMIPSSKRTDPYGIGTQHKASLCPTAVDYLYITAATLRSFPLSNAEHPCFTASLLCHNLFLLRMLTEERYLTESTKSNMAAWILNLFLSLLDQTEPIFMKCKCYSDCVSELCLVLLSHSMQTTVIKVLTLTGIGATKSSAAAAQKSQTPAGMQAMILSLHAKLLRFIMRGMASGIYSVSMVSAWMTWSCMRTVQETWNTTLRNLDQEKLPRSVSAIAFGCDIIPDIFHISLQNILVTLTLHMCPELPGGECVPGDCDMNRCETGMLNGMIGMVISEITLQYYLGISDESSKQRIGDKLDEMSVFTDIIQIANYVLDKTRTDVVKFTPNTEWSLARATDIIVKPSVTMCSEYASSIITRLIVYFPRYLRSTITKSSAKARRDLSFYMSEISNELVVQLFLSLTADMETDESNVRKRCLVKVMSSSRRIVLFDFKQEISDTPLKCTIDVPKEYPLKLIRTNITINKPSSILTQLNLWVSLIVNKATEEGDSLYNVVATVVKNINDKIKGMDECAICFCIVSGTSSSIANFDCSVCHKKFHKHCLYSWFRSSNTDRCPMCRSEFRN